MANNLTRTTATILAGLLLLAGCGPNDAKQPPQSHKKSSAPRKPSPGPLAKCEKAFRKEYRRAQQDQDAGHPPTECRGISERKLKKIAVRVIREETEKLPSGEDG